MLRNSIICFLFLVMSCVVHAQVGKVKRDAKSYKENKQSNSGSTSNEYSDSNDDDTSFGKELANDFVGAILWGLVKLPFYGIAYAQEQQLIKRKAEPWRVDAQVRGILGYQLNSEVLLMRPSASMNWGLFSTSARFTRLSDRTGTLRTLDWQIVQFNLVNKKVIRFRFGMGISHEFDIDQTHFEGTVELSGFIKDRSISPSIEYRWSEDRTPRQELNVSVMKNVREYGLNDLSLLVGYSFQRWYGNDFYLPYLGLNLNID